MKLKLLSLLLLSTYFISCKKEEIIQNSPSVLTNEASEILLEAPYSKVTLNGEVTDEGFAAVTDRGFVYSDKNFTPSVSDLKIKSGYGKGVYSAKLSNLNLNVKFYYRSYATSAKATSYGNVQSFTTADYKLPTVTTKSVTLLNNTVIEFNAEVIDDGGGTINEYGFVIGKKASPTLSNSSRIIVRQGDFGKLNYVIQINADANVKYYIRSYVKNIKGESYGNELTVTTLNKIETLVNTIISPITGRVWMDRNLGASRAAINKGDGLALGDLYQWGRKADGHQISISETTTTLSNSDMPQNGLFITTPTTNAIIGDWKTNPNNNLWQGVNGLNNVCPIGFRIPTIKEFEAEQGPIVGDFFTTLKLPNTLLRTNEGIIFSNQINTYWTSSVSKTDSYSASVMFYGSSTKPSFNNLNPKSFGTAVRCIKN